MHSDGLQNAHGRQGLTIPVAVALAPRQRPGSCALAGSGRLSVVTVPWMLRTVSRTVVEPEVAGCDAAAVQSY